MSMNVVLVEPEIPHNTGAIGRTCYITGTRLHLVRPLGFFVDERSLRRSGLDYWEQLDVSYYDNFDHFLAENKDAAIFCATTKARMRHTDVTYPDNAYLVFGKESAGLPLDIIKRYTSVRVPMREDTRSLNLSVSAGIMLYEALRQNGFPGLR